MKIFYSYCHVDEAYRDRLEKFLVTLRDQGKITEWYDRKILAGERWNEAIKQNLIDADIILLLITQDFLNSEACKEEIVFSLDAHNKKIAIPIIIKDCMWLSTRLKDVEAVPKDGKPITNWDSEDAAWVDVAKHITEVVDNYSKKPISTFLEKLNKTEFVNSGKENISLTDIFVPPEYDFTKVDGKNIETQFSIDSFFINNQHCIIRGDELSGKTGLLNYIYITSIEKGFFPFFVNGENIKKTRNFEEFAINCMHSQYTNLTFESYCHFKSTLLLVDNYNHSISDNFISWAKETFDYVCIAIDMDEQLVFFKDNRCFSDFNQVTLKEMNHYNRYELIKKWKSFERSNYMSEEDFQNEIDNLERNVDSIIINKHIVPNTPFYLLTIIQSFESFMPQDYKITSYGHCYNALIIAKLINAGLSNSDIDDCFNYFTYLAYFMYENCKQNQWELQQEKYEEFKIKYKNDYLILDSLLARIENKDCGIFVTSENSLSFSYPFIFYFFLGRFLAQNQEMGIIEQLCSKIYNRDYANILIFTIHHSINTQILEEIELHCLVSFDSLKVATLDCEETCFMNNLMGTLPKQISSSESIEENRENIRKNRDEIEKENADEDEIISDTSTPEILEIERSLKIIDVLGQIIKNRSGSFPKRTVKELVYEVEKLGLRSLTFFLNTLKDKEFKNWITDRIEVIEKEKCRMLSKERIEKIVEQNIEVMGFVLILGMLQRTYTALSIEKVLPLQEEISSRENSVSFDFFLLFFKLSYKGLNFREIEKYYKKFDEEKNFWAKGVLSIFIQNYLNTHTVKSDDRQRYAHLLGFKYKPNKYMGKYGLK